MKVGDRVRIKVAGESEFYRQSGGGEGAIVYRVLPLDWWNVTWDNGYNNIYPSNSLQLASTYQCMPELDQSYEDILAGQEIYSKLEGKS